MKRWFLNFMYGRNGADEYSRFLSMVCCGVLLLGMLIGGAVGSYFRSFALICLFWCYFRVFSKKLDIRRRENQKFLSYKRKYSSRLKQAKIRFEQRKEYRFFSCPACKTTLRVPKGKGKILIHCKCGEQFMRKS